MSFAARSWILCVMVVAGGGAARGTGKELVELNPPVAPAAGGRAIAIVGATLVDGTDRLAVADAVVVVRGDSIVAAGRRADVAVPAGADVVDGAGMTVTPGLFDAHLHSDGRYEVPPTFLRRGVTTMRDPGAWIETYGRMIKAEEPMPRMFLTGPHLDRAPVAYPKDAVVVNTAAEARAAVNRAADQGGVAIKVYFRLPVELIRAAADAAHARGLPLTGHLELVSAVDAIGAGLDGVEHVTSFGTSIAGPAEVGAYVAAVRAQNEARRQGRYDLWATIDLDHCPRLKGVLELAAARGTVLCPTLAVFERRAGDKGVSDATARGYANMVRFAGMYYRAGGRVVVGSHTDVPKAERGWAYQREMELLVEAGMTPADVIRAATLEGARYFRAADRLGSIEAGKRADLVMVAGDPLKDIAAMRQVRRVMLNGAWVNLDAPIKAPGPGEPRELLRPAGK